MPAGPGAFPGVSLTRPTMAGAAPAAARAFTRGANRVRMRLQPGCAAAAPPSPPAPLLPPSHPGGGRLTAWSTRAWDRRRYRAGASPAPNDAPPPPDPGAALLAWLASVGGSAPGVTIAPSPLGGAGLVAASPASPGALLVTVPRAALLSDGGLPPNPTPEDAAALPFSPAAVAALAEQVPPELWGARLALGLLAHRAAGSASPLAPYVAALPSTFSTPLFFSPAAVAALQYAPLVAQVNKRARWVGRFAQEHLDKDTALLPFSGVGVDAGGLAWALSAVTSRAFRLGGPASLPSLVPVIDMCNHEAGSPGARVVPGLGGGASLVAARELAAGEAVTISYGDGLTNDAFLNDYGFLPSPTNPADAVAVRLTGALLSASAALAGLEPRADAGAAWRRAAAVGAGAGPAFSGEEGGGGGVEAKITGSPPHAGPRLLAAARITAATRPGDLGAGASDPALLGDPATPLTSPPAEAAAWRLVAALCIGSLASFPTAATEDREVLKRGDLPPDVRAAAGLAAEKKELLAGAGRWAGARAQAAAAGGAGSGGGGATAPRPKGPPPAATVKGFGKKTA